MLWLLGTGVVALWGALILLVYRLFFMWLSEGSCCHSSVVCIIVALSGDAVALSVILSLRRSRGDVVSYSDSTPVVT